MKVEKEIIRVKRPLRVECFKCSVSFEVKFNPGKGKHVEKNNWGYWTNKEVNANLFICDSCLVNLYRKDKWECLENITDDNRRRVLRTYIYGYNKTIRNC